MEQDGGMDFSPSLSNKLTVTQIVVEEDAGERRTVNSFFSSIMFAELDSVTVF